MEAAYLFGPFIGSLFWEVHKFCGYALYMKKEHPKHRLLLMTRPERFDFYGEYGDIFVPLKWFNNNIDKEKNQNCFKLNGLHESIYYDMVSFFYNKYKDKYNIVDHFYPDIRGFRYKLKWQFPRYKMIYDFMPRNENNIFVDKLLNNSKPCILFDFSWTSDNNLKHLILSKFKKFTNYNFVVYDDSNFYEEGIIFVNKSLNFIENTSLYGVILSILKRSFILVGNLKSDISKISLLSGLKSVLIMENLSNDEISLINPKKTKVFLAKNIGDINENNI